MVLTDLWAEIICGGIVKMLPTQSSSTDVNCPLLQSEQKVEKVEVWMRRDRFMRLKLSLRLPPDTQCSPKISILHIIPVRTNSSWGTPMTIHIRETNLSCSCVYSAWTLMPVQSQMLSSDIGGECPGGPLVKLEDSIRVLQFKMISFQQDGQSWNKFYMSPPIEIRYKAWDKIKF